MHVTVIAKAPVPGRVKTRLSPPCSPEQAAELAAAAIADTLDAVTAAMGHRAVRRVLLFDGEPGPWAREGFDVVAQSGGDLAHRLAHGFAVLGPGLVVGMETPQAVASGIGDALEHLHRGRDVLGPALDGGYWAIGLGRPDPRVFAGIEMSTSQTGTHQLRRMRAHGRTVALLPVARDIDTFEDVRALAATTWNGRAAQVARRLVADVDGPDLDHDAGPLALAPTRP